MLSEELQSLRDSVQAREHTGVRRHLEYAQQKEIEQMLQNRELPLVKRASLRLRLLLENENVVLVPGLEFFGMRTLTEFPDIYAPGEKDALTRGKYVHEQGRVCNIAYDYPDVLKNGLLPRRERIEKTTADADYRDAALEVIDATLAFVDRHCSLVEAMGEKEYAEELRASVRCGAKSFKSALQTFRMLHMVLWASNVYHNTVGRFDQYMLPFYKKDIAEGKLTRERALTLLEEFFLTFNLDSDFYTGMQQGDNGQSMMLGGCDSEGRSAYNDLTELCLKASLEMRLIDPKINLRVNKDTPLSVYELCTQLTRQGLGFPQYANDDVVIPGLIRLGYAPEDARNYVVAACWEFIIPGVAMDIPNIGAISLAKVADDVIREKLTSCETFDELKQAFADELKTRAAALAKTLAPLFMEPAPYASVLMSDCTHDVSEGAKYNNYGVHGTGCTIACDALASVRKYVYETKEVSKARLLRALETGFAEDSDLLSLLRCDAPKLGRDEENDELADFVLNAFADALEGLTNERGGIFRAGTGSAMYYIWHAKELGYTADGHIPGEPFPANFSPSLLLRDAGPLSVVQSFARPGVKCCINGGPLTLELHDTVFKRADGITKVAQLVRSFIQLGGHQLQLNSVNVEKLKDAQEHPENYGNLIVRVWGWSGHFVLLDRSYQDQIIARTSYSI